VLLDGEFLAARWSISRSMSSCVGAGCGLPSYCAWRCSISRSLCSSASARAFSA
jgi:hypothetical protein